MDQVGDETPLIGLRRFPSSSYPEDPSAASSAIVEPRGRFCGSRSGQNGTSLSTSNLLTLPAAVKEGKSKYVNWFLKGANTDVSERDEEGYAAIHYAAQYGQIDTLRLILSKSKSQGACTDVNIEGKHSITALHLAAKHGRTEAVRCLIDAGANIFAIDSEQRTPLDCAADGGHVEVMSSLLDAALNVGVKASISPYSVFLASRRGHLKAVQLLLEKGVDVNYQQEETFFNCLDIAVENGHKEVAMAIVRSHSWKDALRNAVGRETPMTRMIRKMPAVAHLVLDQCLTDNATVENPDIVNSKEYKVSLDFEFLEDWSISNEARDATYAVDRFHAPGKSKELKSSCWKLQGFSKLRHPLLQMVRFGRVDLLRHPVVSGLLERKRKKYGRSTFFLNFATYILFLIFLTSYSLRLPHPDHLYCHDYSVVGSVSSLPLPNQTCPWENVNVTRGDPTVPSTAVSSHVLYVFAVGVLLFGGGRFVYEIFQAVLTRSYVYLLEIENYIEIATYILSIIFVADFGVNCWCPTSWQWQLGAVAVFLAWINFILFLKRVPLLGIYVLMYTNIVYTFLRVVIIALLFVVAFSLAFYMILYKPVLHNQIINMSPFRTPGLSIIKTVVMTIGEFEYDDVFANTNDDNNQLTDFASLAYLLWILFLVMMPILLVNLLVALAVDDTKAIQNKAHMSKIEIQIKLMLKAERMLALLPKRITPQLIVRDHVVRPNRRLNLWERFKIKWGVERWDSVDNIRKYRKPDMSVVCHVKAQTKELANQIKELKAQLAKKSEMERLALETAEELKAELARRSARDDQVLGGLQDSMSSLLRAVEELGKGLPNPTTKNSQ